MRIAFSTLALVVQCAGVFALAGCDKKPPLPPAPMVSALGMVNTPSP